MSPVESLPNCAYQYSKSTQIPEGTIDSGKGIHFFFFSFFLSLLDSYVERNKITTTKKEHSILTQQKNKKINQGRKTTRHKNSIQEEEAEEEGKECINRQPQPAAIKGIVVIVVVHLPHDINSITTHHPLLPLLQALS